MKSIRIMCFFLFLLLIPLSLSGCMPQRSSQSEKPLATLIETILIKNREGTVPFQTKTDSVGKTAEIKLFYPKNFQQQKQVLHSFVLLRKELSDCMEAGSSSVFEKDYTVRLQLCYRKSKEFLLLEATNQNAYAAEKHSDRLDSLSLRINGEEADVYFALCGILTDENELEDIKNLSLSNSMFTSWLSEMPNLQNIYAEEHFTKEDQEAISQILPNCRIRSGPDRESEWEILSSAIENRRLESSGTREVLFFLEDGSFWRFLSPGLKKEIPEESTGLLFQHGSYEITEDAQVRLELNRQWSICVTGWKPSEYLLNGARYYCASDWKIVQSETTKKETYKINLGSDNWSMDARPDLYLDYRRYLSDDRYLNETGGLHSDGSDPEAVLAYLLAYYQLLPEPEEQASFQ